LESWGFLLKLNFFPENKLKGMMDDGPLDESVLTVAHRPLGDPNPHPIIRKGVPISHPRMVDSNSVVGHSADGLLPVGLPRKVPPSDSPASIKGRDVSHRERNHVHSSHLAAQEAWTLFGSKKNDSGMPETIQDLHEGSNLK
jgi:hypothetical protein